jgi:hypothetical protein
VGNFGDQKWGDNRDLAQGGSARVHGSYKAARRHSDAYKNEEIKAALLRCYADSGA